MWLHRFAVFVSASTVLLIVAGGLVTSTASGLAVPDWPTTYGWSMFTFPLDRMVGGIFYEHGHRLIATSVGMLTIVLAVWLWFGDRRRWLRRLGLIALAAVCTQGLLGGLTVLFFLPAPISIAHAGLAQLFFCLTVSIALFTSPSWQRRGSQTSVDHDQRTPSKRSVDPKTSFLTPVVSAFRLRMKLRRTAVALAEAVRRTRGRMKPATDDEPAVHESRLRIVASVTTVAIYLQVLVGAMMRHTAAGLAIPDFPLVFGGLLPPEWTPGIAVHFAHRVGALLVASAVVATAGHIWYHHRWRHDLTWPATMAVLLVLVQIALGGLTVLSRRAVSINTAHVVTGALLLATSLVISLRSWRERFVGTTDVDVEAGLKTRLCQADGVSRRSSVGARA